MNVPPPQFSVHHTERARDCEAAFQSAMRDLMVRAVEAGWREAEAAMAMADAAENYVIYLAEQPKKHLSAANSN
jgi:hypothetical protein